MKKIKLILIFVLIGAMVMLSLLTGCKKNDEEKKNLIATDKDYISYYGRVYIDPENKSAEIANTASGFEITFSGTELSADLNASGTGEGNTFIKVFADDELYNKFELNGRKVVKIFKATDAKERKIKVLKITEAQYTMLRLYELKTDGVFNKTTAKEPKTKIAFYGDSITAGYGNIGNSGGYYTHEQDGLLTYATLTAKNLNADVDICAYSGWAIDKAEWHTQSMRIPEIYNYYSSWRKVPYYTSASEADVVVINLGTNDYTYYQSHISEINVFRTKYIEFYHDIRALYLDAEIILAYGMMNWGNLTNTISLSIDKVLQAAAENSDTKIHKVKLYTAILAEDLGANGHPSVIAHEKAAAELTTFIKNVF